MAKLRWKVLSACTVAALASASAFAQTGGSGAASSSSSGGAIGGSAGPASAGSVTSPSAPTPATPNSSSSSITAPSAVDGQTMGAGPDRALATPEDRAKCASLSGTSKADCMEQSRKERERPLRGDSGMSGRGRM